MVHSPMPANVSSWPPICCDLLLCCVCLCLFVCLCRVEKIRHAAAKYMYTIINWLPPPPKNKGLGACTGFVLYTGAQYAKRYGYLSRSQQLNRNVGMLMTLVGFAFGTFLGASITGKEEIHNLHPIFRAGAAVDVTAAPDASASSSASSDDGGRQQKLGFQARWFQARKEVQQQQEAGEGGAGAAEVDRQRLQNMRMTRRRTLMNNIHQGHGLSDSHSGRWVEENSETKFDKE